MSETCPFLFNRCVEESSLIRDYVSFHFVSPTSHLFSHGIKTSKQAMEYTVDCKKPLKFAPKTYRKLHYIPYPINTVRNVGRVSATSHYIFPSDLELYPSPGLIQEFLRLVTEGIYSITET